MIQEQKVKLLEKHATYVELLKQNPKVANKILPYEQVTWLEFEKEYAKEYEKLESLFEIAEEIELLEMCIEEFGKYLLTSELTN